MKKIKTRLAPLALLLASGLSQAGDYAVVVHKDNTLNGDEKHLKQQIKLLFLKQKFRWQDNLRATPMSSASSSEMFQRFRDDVLGMTSKELSQHWIRLKLNNGDSPPREVSLERVAIRLVEKDPGAFCIVSRERAEKAGDKVRVLFEF